MRSGFDRKQREKGATMILLLTMIPIFLIPLVGLAIDGTMRYLVQAKLSGAVDGAALGAGRLLGTQANTDEIANEFLNVNFPAGWWNTRNLTPNISSSSAGGRSTINVAATVDLPLLFMRIIGWDHVTLGATAQATRSDTRVELVLDRSGSMNTVDPISGLNVFTTMIAGAKNFVGTFTPGTDQLGLVAFGGSAIVAYPTGRPYNSSPASAGGPDTAFAVDSTTGPMFNQLNAMVAGSGTGMAEAISLAYIEIQKAHNRDFTANGADNRLNSIVLFTDGVPTALAVQPNFVQPGNTTVVSNASGCTYNALQASGSAHIMTGWLAVPGKNINDWSQAGWNPYGLWDLSAYDTAYTLTQWLGYQTAGALPYDELKSVPFSAVSNCNNLYSGANNYWLNDLSKIPPTDLYGNSTSSTDNGYQLSNKVYSGTNYDPNQPTNSVHVGVAIWNAVDNAGKTIRTQNIMSPISIYTIGYSGNGGIDDVLLKRLANQADSTSFVATQPQGFYIQVNDANGLGAAFAQIASSLLRLAK